MGCEFKNPDNKNSHPFNLLDNLYKINNDKQ
jgi:hypothetical protein